MAGYGGGGTLAGPPNGPAGGELGGTYPDPTVDAGADGTAIHDDTPGEIAAVTLKAVPVGADLLIIEDSASANAKKHTTAQAIADLNPGFDGTFTGVNIDFDPTGTYDVSMDVGQVWTTHISDNLANAWLVQEGGNNYIAIGTLDAGATMVFGNATTNPAYEFLGNNTLTLGGTIIMNGAQISGGTGWTTINTSSSGTSFNWNFKDNNASPLRWRAANITYFGFKSTQDKEQVQASMIFATTEITTVDMADVTHTLVLGTAGANQTKLVGNIIYVDANSTGAGENLLWPPEADMKGVTVTVVNTGGEDVVIRDDADATTIITVSTGEIGMVTCDGTTLRGGIMATT